MSRSVYSVVLDDAIVAQVDREALRAGTNRSAMMNRLLAAQLQYDTPEERIRTVLGAMQQLTATHYTALQASAGEAVSQLLLRSALRYKYSPTVRYTLELYAHPQAYLGVLRCQLRTQNPALLAALAGFYRLWITLETGTLHTPAALYEVQGARMARVLRLPAQPCGEQQLAERLTAYVSLLDDCMKLYCEHLDDSAAPHLTALHWQSRLTPQLAAL